MNQYPKDKIIIKFRYLWTWELFDSFAIPALVLFVARMLRQSIGPIIVYSSFVLAGLLWQGSAFCLLKMRAIQHSSAIGGTALCLFAVLKKMNWLFFAIWPLLFIGQLKGSRPINLFDTIVGTIIFIQALLEQVNYYYYQLMYDRPSEWRYLLQFKKLKKSLVRRELERFRL